MKSASPDRRTDLLSPELAASDFNCAREGFIVADCTGRVIRANEALTRVTGYDTLARLGADEFVAGLFDLQQPHDCEPVLRCMVQAASAPILIDGIIVQLSASIGVAFFPLHGQEMETLIAKADQAMYVSKRAGGDRVGFCGEWRCIDVALQRRSD